MRDGRAFTFLLLPVLASCAGQAPAPTAAPPAATPIPAAAGECRGRATDAWLLGTWERPHTEVVFRRAGATVEWTFTREAGVTTSRWGDKAAATGKGTVTAVAGCRVMMTGAYTSYGKTISKGPDPVGFPMEYDMTLDDGGDLTGTGYGYGRETYRTNWRKRR